MGGVQGRPTTSRSTCCGARGVYIFNRNNPDIVTENGYEVPASPGVRLNRIMTNNLSGPGTINHIVNGCGPDTRRNSRSGRSGQLREPGIHRHLSSLSAGVLRPLDLMAEFARLSGLAPRPEQWHSMNEQPLRYLSWIVTLPLAVLAISFAGLSNRDPAVLKLWPLPFELEMPTFLPVARGAGPRLRSRRLLSPGGPAATTGATPAACATG